MNNKATTKRDILIGALIAIFTTVATQVTFSSWTLSQERKSLESAFYGEISAIISVVRDRNLPLLVKEAINNTEKEGKAFFPDFSVRGSYFNVYRSSTQTGKLGLLRKPLPKEIAIFYTYAESVVEDLNWMSEVDSSEVSKEKAIKDLISLKGTLKTLSVGDKIVSKLERGS